MRYILTALIFILITALLCCVSKKRFGQCLPVSMIGTALLIYVSGFAFGTFSVAYIVIYLVAALAVPVLVLRIRSDRSETRDNILTAGFWCFVFIIVLVYVYDYGRCLIEWDDRSHWGMMVKEMIRLDDWYFAKDTRLLVHKDYPPFTSIFELFWCHVVGKYHESALLHGIHVLTLSLFTPLIADSADKAAPVGESERPGFGVLSKGMKALVALLGTWYFMGVFDAAKLFRTSYTDIVLSFIFVYGMALIIRDRILDDKFDYVGLLFATCALLLTKQMGIAFVLLIWLAYLIGAWRRRKEPGMIKQGVIKGILLIAVPLILKSFWNMALKKEGIVGQFALSTISAGDVINVIKDRGAISLQRRTLNDFVHALFLKNITSLDVTFTYVSATIIVLIVLFILRGISEEKNLKKKATDLIITFICGTFGYAFTLSILYLFCFSEAEMSQLASYERYAGCYIMAEFFIIVIFICTRFDIKKIVSDKKPVLIVGAVFMLLVSGSTFKIFIPAVFEPASNEEYEEAAIALDNVTDENDTVFILSKDTLLSQYYINYYGEQFRVIIDAEDYFDKDYSVNEEYEYALRKVFGYDYLYVKDINDTFNVAFRELNGSEDFAEGRIYRIEDESGIRRAYPVN